MENLDKIAVFCLFVFKLVFPKGKDKGKQTPPLVSFSIESPQVELFSLALRHLKARHLGCSVTLQVWREVAPPPQVMQPTFKWTVSAVDPKQEGLE